MIKKVLENTIKLIKIPPNMTQLFQLLDLTVNGVARAYHSLNGTVVVFQHNFMMVEILKMLQFH